jgi:hypothetical protein
MANNFLKKHHTYLEELEVLRHLVSNLGSRKIKPLGACGLSRAGAAVFLFPAALLRASMAQLTWWWTRRARS